MTDAMGRQNDCADDSGIQLDFDVDPSIGTALDGAWWPQTRDSATELARLVSALQAKDAVVGLIMLNPHGWLCHPRRIEVAHRTVRIVWTPSLDPAILVGATVGGRRIDLLLVWTETDQTDRRGGTVVDGRAPGVRPPVKPTSPHAARRASMLATTQALAPAPLDGD